jgi:hypothetical protein
VKFVNVADSSHNLANEARQASDLLVAFHSRLSKKAVNKPWEHTLPTRFYCIGEVDRTDYASDKDDPETREPHKRANDPDGVQGVWKVFTHQHDPGVRIYTTRKNYGKLQRDRGFGGALAPPSDCAEVEWPSLMTYLNELLKFDVLLPDGRIKPLNCRGLQLWSFPDSNTLVAMRSPNDYDSPDDSIYILHGGDLCVTWRGIQH